MDLGTVVAPSVAKPIRLRPFRAVMLASGRVGDPASARALARPYRDVAERLTGWIAQGRALRDVSPALYLHEYTTGGLTVRGLVGLLDVSDLAHGTEDRAVLPHERVHPEQARELADRMQEMGVNPAPILLVHEGESTVRDLVHLVSDREPDWSYLDRAGQQQRLWAIRDEAEVAVVAKGLGEIQMLLADGHHRYAAYLDLHTRDPDPGWAGGLAMVVDQGDTPLFLGPIHRSMPGWRIQELEEAARAAGATVQRSTRASALAQLDATTVVLTDATLWSTVVPPRSAPECLAVEWWHTDVLGGGPASPDEAPRVRHHHSVEDALAAAGATSPALLLPAPDFATVIDIVSHGRLLPEKATSFQPKPSLGVLMRPVHDD